MSCYGGAWLALERAANERVAGSKMDEAEARQRATDALITRMIQALDLELVETLPAPVPGFKPDRDWFLFVVNDARRRAGTAEYVAIHRAEGTVLFLGAGVRDLPAD